MPAGSRSERPGLVNVVRDGVSPNAFAAESGHAARDAHRAVVPSGGDLVPAGIFRRALRCTSSISRATRIRFSRGCRRVKCCAPARALRELPEGYEESVVSGVNRIRDPAMAAYYNRLQLITRGPALERTAVAGNRPVEPDGGRPRPGGPGSMMRLSRSPLFVLMSALLLIVLIRTAWVSDDAFITFRTIDNFNHGFGLRWNVDERVQTYTHPLWMLLLIALSQFAPLYYGTIVLSIGLTMAAIAVLAARVARSHESAIVALTILVFSRAFTDFSSSGLENPLTHLLLGLFFWLYFSDRPTDGASVALGLVAGLAVLNRLDIALLIGPAVAVTWARDRRHVVASAMAAVIPVAIWEAFAIVYYGFPLPNTVYAKLQTGIPAMELAAHGLTYLRDSLASDPITLTTIALGVARRLSTLLAVPVSRERSGTGLGRCLGVGLYLAGLMRAGGDFMSGRMLATPLFCTVVLLTRFEWIAGERRALVLCASATVLGLAAPRPTVWSNAVDTDTKIASSGIADERRFYQPSTGLLSAAWRGEYPVARMSRRSGRWRGARAEDLPWSPRSACRDTGQGRPSTSSIRWALAIRCSRGCPRRRGGASATIDAICRPATRTASNTASTPSRIPPSPRTTNDCGSSLATRSGAGAGRASSCARIWVDTTTCSCQSRLSREARQLVVDDALYRRLEPIS